MHQRDGEVTQPSWNISSSGVPPPDRCVPHRPHHPSQPVMRYLRGRFSPKRCYDPPETTADMA